METTVAYITTILTALVFLLIAAFIATAIQFEHGSRPRDRQKRRTWFWILAVINPMVGFTLGAFVFKPNGNILIMNRYMNALSIGTAIGFVVYILLGFVLSRMFRNGKLGQLV